MGLAQGRLYALAFGSRNRPAAPEFVLFFFFFFSHGDRNGSRPVARVGNSMVSGGGRFEADPARKTRPPAFDLR